MMGHVPRHADVAWQRLQAALVTVKDVVDGIPHGFATRDDLDLAIAEILGAERDFFGPRGRASKGEGAAPRILAYLKDHVGEVVSGEELRAASGFIGEWARRVRELNVEHGWDIDEL